MNNGHAVNAGTWREVWGCVDVEPTPTVTVTITPTVTATVEAGGIPDDIAGVGAEVLSVVGVVLPAGTLGFLAWFGGIVGVVGLLVWRGVRALR